MENIKHIVYLMLENRSLDNILGWLYSGDDQPKHFIPKVVCARYDGLEKDRYYNEDIRGGIHYAAPVNNGSQQVPSYDPHEPYKHVNMQLYGKQENPKPNKEPDMSGFYKDYATVDSANTDQIMKSYTLKDLPVINTLAKNYAVSDRYFASLPTQTNCNRAFAATGNSLGTYYNTSGTLGAWVDNYWGKYEVWDLDVTFNQTTIWEVLNNHGYSTTDDWSIFYSHQWPVDHPYSYCFTRDLFPNLQHSSYDPYFSDIDEFYRQAEAGTLPKFSFLEPSWFLQKDGIGRNGNDYHPPANLNSGENFLRKIYKTLRSNQKAWEKTLFIINFDEHGGTYDHVPPEWNAPKPWENPKDGTPSPSTFDQGFQFDRYGVRVPLILVSPLIEPFTVIRPAFEQPYPFDHCSVIATILKHFQIDPSKSKMGSRVATAPTFEDVVTLTTARTDTPDWELRDDDPNEQKLAPISDLQLMIAHRTIGQAFKKSGIDKQIFQDIYDVHFSELNTQEELSEAITAVLKAVEEKM